MAAANYLNAQISSRYRRSQLSLNGPSKTLSEGNEPGTPPSEPAADDASPPNANKRRSKDDAAKPAPKRLKTGGKRPTDAKGKHSPPNVRLCDLGGLEAAIEQLLELVAMPLCHPEIYLHTGVRPPRGVLLHGPPGCGKTMLAAAIAGELGCPFINVSAPSIVSGMSGESEKTLRDTFEEAIKNAPCILFIDEIDAITGKRENAQREMERRIVAQLLTCLDDLSWDKTDNKPVMLLGATNRPDSLDPALRRAGRFDHEIAIGVPDQAARERILRVLVSNLRLSGDFDFTNLAKQTPGYVGADLEALASAAGILAVKRIFKQLGGPEPLSTIESSESTPVSAVPPPDEGMAVDPAEAEPEAPAPANGDETNRAVPDRPTLFANLPTELQQLSIASFLQKHTEALTEAQLLPLSLNNDDFLLALQQVQPSSKREGFTTVPGVTWAEIGALEDIRDELRMSIVQPIRTPELFEALGIGNPCGVLLWGPPGCGKTLLAKAVANESMANFISVKGPELLNKYVGESERAVRQVFARARASAPCIIFFDELDALVPRRDDNLSESSARVVNTLLTELDGLESRKQVYVIAATNRPDIVDPAMVRPGRLDKMLYVDLPTPLERISILKAQSHKTPFAPDVDWQSIAHDPLCDRFSGADLNALIRESALAALKDAFASGLEGTQVGLQVRMAHIKLALHKVSPSVSVAQQRRYEALRSKFSGQPVGHRKEATEELSQST